MKPTAPSLAGLSQKCKLTCAAAAAGLLFAVSGAQAQALTPKQESIIPIAALTAEGDAARLKTVLADALNRKSMTVNEMKDVLLQMYAYTGFPRSLTGLGVLVNLLDERHTAGITDEKGREATPLHQERELATISALASLPAPVQLRSHLNASLNVGLSPKALREFTEILRRDVGSTEAALAQTTLDAVLAQRAAK